MNLGHFVRVWIRLCVFISTSAFHFKEFAIWVVKHCCFWVSQLCNISPRLALANINAFFYVHSYHFNTFQFAVQAKCSPPKPNLNTTASVIILRVPFFCLTFHGYLNYNLWFQHLYQSAFPGVFHIYGFSSREITGAKWSNDFLYMCQL